MAAHMLIRGTTMAPTPCMHPPTHAPSLRLEAQLEEALAQRDPVHKPAIDIDTPADKTLKLLDKIMRGHEVGTALRARQLGATHSSCGRACLAQRAHLQEWDRGVGRAGGTSGQGVPAGSGDSR